MKPLLTHPSPDGVGDWPQRRAPTLRQFACFKEVAHHQSFSRAATAMGMSQPALSLAIRDLELSMGVPLFERSTHFVRLTSVGEVVRSQVERIVSNYQLGVQDLQRKLQWQADTLRIACIPSVAQLAVPWIARWYQQHPLVFLRWTDMNDDTLAAAVESGEIHIGLGLDLRAASTLEIQLVAEGKMMAVMAAGHALAHMHSLGWADLRDQPLVMLSHGSNQRVISHAMAQNNVDVSQAQSVSYVESLCAMARTGLFVGVISSLYERSYLTKGLTAIPIEAPGMTWHVRLMTRHCPPELRPPIVQACWEYLCEKMGMVPTPR